MTNPDLLPVAPNRKLFIPEQRITENGITEVFDLEDKTHLMRFSGRPDQWEQYAILQGAGISLPPASSVEQSPEQFELVIPLVAKPIVSQLDMIKRDVATYADVLFELGDYLASVHNATGLIPTIVSDRDLLASIMMYDNPSPESGVGMLLVPPFYLEQNPTTKRIHKEVLAELRGSHIFSDEELEYLMGALEVGLDSVV